MWSRKVKLFIQFVKICTEWEEYLGLILSLKIYTYTHTHPFIWSNTLSSHTLQNAAEAEQILKQARLQIQKEHMFKTEVPKALPRNGTQHFQVSLSATSNCNVKVKNRFIHRAPIYSQDISGTVPTTKTNQQTVLSTQGKIYQIEPCLMLGLKHPTLSK